MRFLHTSDWHVGVLLGGKDRTQEHAVFLEELFDIVSEEKVEAVLISGDIFDTPNPPAESEKLVFDFFRKMAEAKVSVVFIAGNHDSGARIEGRARLLQLVHVHAFGKPQKQASVEISNSKNELLIVAALPFAGELRLLDWDESGQKNQGDQKSTFAEKMGGLLSILERTHFRPDAVNVLMAHLTVDGALLSGSEKSIRMSDTWSVPAGLFPKASYVALGHIHKPQACKNGQAPIVYSGSPLYIDFGEEKDEKGVYIVDALPGRPPDIRFRKLERLTRLKTLRVPLRDLEATAEEFRNFQGHVKMVVKLEEEARPRIAEDVRRLLPQTLIINVEAVRPDKKELPNMTIAANHPVEAYKLYLQSLNRAASPELLETFQDLMEEALHAPA